MKIVVQRVKNAKVEVDNKIVGKIEKGFMFVGSPQIRGLEKENNKLYRILDKFHENIDKFISWICKNLIWVQKII